MADNADAQGTLAEFAPQILRRAERKGLTPLLLAVVVTPDGMVRGYGLKAGGAVWRVQAETHPTPASAGPMRVLLFDRDFDRNLRGMSIRINSDGEIFGGQRFLINGPDGRPVNSM